MSATVTPTDNLNSTLGTDPGLARLYDNIMLQVPAVGFSLVKIMVWDTIEEFYLRSVANQVDVFWEMGIGVTELDFNPYDATWQVAWILDVSGLTYPQIIMPGKLLDTQPNGSTFLRKGSAHLALKPVSFTTNLPPELFIQWFETILNGALGRLYMQPAKPWSSPQLGAYHTKKYKGGIAMARGIADKQYTNGGGRWRFPQQQGFAFGRRKN